jgi:hypothetical protein
VCKDRSGGRQPAVGVSNVIATEYVFVESGVRPPAVVQQTRLQHRYRTRSRILVVCKDRSGGRQPAVGVSMVIATEYVFVESGVRPLAVVRGSGLDKALWQSRGRLPAVS